MGVLIGDIAEKLVFDERAAQGSAQCVAVQLRDIFIRGNVSVLLVEIWRGIERVSAAVNIRRAVNGICARRGAQVDVGAAGRALLRVVHGRVDAKLLNGLWGGCGQGLADGEIGRRGALNYLGRSAARTRNARVIYNSG